ncbi:unnamed protein product, partial [Discosporangium mesarthrocarpum]
MSTLFARSPVSLFGTDSVGPEDPKIYAKVKGESVPSAAWIEEDQLTEPSPSPEPICWRISSADVEDAWTKAGTAGQPMDFQRGRDGDQADLSTDGSKPQTDSSRPLSSHQDTSLSPR